MNRQVTCLSENGIEIINISVSDREQFKVIDLMMEGMEKVIDTIYQIDIPLNREKLISNQCYVDTINALANYLLPVGYSYQLSINRSGEWLLEVL